MISLCFPFFHIFAHGLLRYVFIVSNSPSPTSTTWTNPDRRPKFLDIPINGLVYLHSCHILHRGLKPANILITSAGVAKIADLGLPRLIFLPLQPLFIGNKVVVTIWYRAPELLMGAKHYNKAVDCYI